MARHIFISIIAFFTLIPLGNAQEDTAPVIKSFFQEDKRWNVELPLWVPGFRGQLAYGEVQLSQLPEMGGDPEPPDREFSFLDYSNSIEYYFVGRVTFSPGKFFFSLDAIGGSLGNQLKLKRPEVELVNASISFSVPRFQVGYEVFDHWTKEKKCRLTLSPFTGVRWFLIDAKADVIINPELYKTSIDWLEPFIGVKFISRWERWRIDLSGDIGASSHSVRPSWMVHAAAHYLLGRTVYLKGGWSMMGIERSATVNDENYDVKINLSGPMLGIGFQF